MTVYLCDQDNRLGLATVQAMDDLGVRQMHIRSGGVEGPQTFGNLIISRSEVTEFNRWVDGVQDLPDGQPIVLDYEGPMRAEQGTPWWRYARGDLIPSGSDGRRIAAAYSASLYFALRARPEAAWGVWGLPDARMTILGHSYWWRLMFMGALEAFPVWHPQGYLMPRQTWKQGGWVGPHLRRVLDHDGGRHQVIAWFNLRHGLGAGGVLVSLPDLREHLRRSIDGIEGEVDVCLWTHGDHDDEDADALREVLR